MEHIPFPVSTMNTGKLIPATYFVIKKESVIIVKIQITTTFF